MALRLRCHGIAVRRALQASGFTPRPIFGPFWGSTGTQQIVAARENHTPSDNNKRLLSRGQTARRVTKDKTKELKSAARTLLAKLDEENCHPAEHLLEILTSGRPSTSELSVGFEAYWTILAELPRNQRVDAIKSKPIAEVLLQHLQANTELWAATVNDPYLALMLCYFATAEGYENRVLHWVHEYVPGDIFQHIIQRLGHGGFNNAWRINLSYNMIKALFLLESSRRADRAIETISKIVKENRRKRKFFVTGAFYYLNEQLTSGQYWETEARLYTEYETLFEQSVATEKLPMKPCKLESARLRLYHPTEPTPDAAIAYIQKYLSSVTAANKDTLLPKPGSEGRLLLEVFFRRTSEIAKKAGRRKDREMVDRKAMDLGFANPSSVTFRNLKLISGVDTPARRPKAPRKHSIPSPSLACVPE